MIDNNVVDAASLDVTKPWLGQVRICPEAAIVWMERNIGNRWKRQSGVEFFKAIIRRGEWQPDHTQSIVFSKSGKLIDGQHRLQAVVETGITIVARVETGVRDELREHLDTGIPRALQDRVTFHGNLFTNRIVVQIVNFLACMQRYATEHGNRAARLTPAMAREVFSRMAENITYSAEQLYGWHCPGVATSPTFSAIAEYHRLHPIRCETFVSCLKSPDGAGGVQQALYLKNALQSMKLTGGGMVASMKRYRMTIYAMRCHTSGRSIRSMRDAEWSNDEKQFLGWSNWNVEETDAAGRSGRV